MGHRGVRLGGQPGFQWGEALRQVRPLFPGEPFLGAKEGRDHLIGQGRDGVGPGRVDALMEGQGGVGGDIGQRQGRHVVAGLGQVATGQGLEVLFRSVQQATGPGVEGRQLAAGERNRPILPRTALKAA